MAELNLGALRRTPSPDEAADLRRRARAGEFGPTGGSWIAIAIGVLVVAFIALWLFLATRFGFFESFLGDDRRRLFFLVWAGLFAFGLFAWFRAMARGVQRRNEWMKLALFARENGLGFRRHSADPHYPGLLFERGDARASSDHVWSPTGRLADAGTYRYSTGSGEDRETHYWSFAAFRLPRTLPHLVLDSTGNDSLSGSNLPVEFSGSQRVTLGQPFDAHYRLFAPAGYGRDAFALFPPDLMQHLIDVPATWDLEIVDDWLFLYARGVDFTAAATWETLGRVEETVVARLSRIAERYTDDHAGPRPVPALLGGAPVGDPGRAAPPVAPGGRRLQTTWVRSAVVFVLMLAAMYAFKYVAELLLFR